MPHVIVHFDPARVAQKVVSELKIKLQVIVAEALSSPALLSTTEPRRGEDIKVHVDDVYVGQWQAHETDVNPASIEIKVEAGRPKGCNPKVAVQMIEAAVLKTGLIPRHALDVNMFCVWVIFNEIHAS